MAKLITIAIHPDDPQAVEIGRDWDSPGDTTEVYSPNKPEAVAVFKQYILIEVE